MTDPRLAITAIPREVSGAQETETAIFSLAWQTIQKWGETVNQIKKQGAEAERSEQRAWIALADAAFRLRAVLESHVAALPDDARPALTQVLEITIQRMEQELALNDITVSAPVGAHYTDELADIIENVEQVVRADIIEPVIHEVMVPVIEQHNQVIRFGKAIIAVPAQD